MEPEPPGAKICRLKPKPNLNGACFITVAVKNSVVTKIVETLSFDVCQIF